MNWYLYILDNVQGLVKQMSREAAALKVMHFYGEATLRRIIIEEIVEAEWGGRESLDDQADFINFIHC